MADVCKSLFIFLGVMALLSPWSWAAEKPVVEPVDKVNINEASPEQLAEKLKGVGMRKAMAIVKYREQHGPFGDVEDLVKVRGIGKSIVRRNKDRIVLGD